MPRKRKAAIKQTRGGVDVLIEELQCKHNGLLAEVRALHFRLERLERENAYWREHFQRGAMPIGTPERVLQ